eukprot:2921205-Pleurochrysis_carterae.AAC.1
MLVAECAERAPPSAPPLPSFPPSTCRDTTHTLWKGRTCADYERGTCNSLSLAANDAPDGCEVNDGLGTFFQCGSCPQTCGTCPESCEDDAEFIDFYAEFFVPASARQGFERVTCAFWASAGCDYENLCELTGACDQYKFCPEACSVCTRSPPAPPMAPPPATPPSPQAPLAPQIVVCTDTSDL